MLCSSHKFVESIHQDVTMMSGELNFEILRYRKIFIKCYNTKSQNAVRGNKNQKANVHYTYSQISRGINNWSFKILEKRHIFYFSWKFEMQQDSCGEPWLLITWIDIAHTHPVFSSSFHLLNCVLTYNSLLHYTILYSYLQYQKLVSTENFSIIIR